MRRAKFKLSVILHIIYKTYTDIRRWNGLGL